MSGRRAAAQPRRTAMAESRWPAIGALVVALAAYGTLPSSVPLLLRAAVGPCSWCPCCC
jgi:hypothetical protein